ncbi:MAG: type 2 lantipeptide synthetase LanM family protein, partial [Xanthomonadales bacterium]|nr:type 2 lantipeptide synthetase LanM family protein [Xanthomonadales bacterium]
QTLPLPDIHAQATAIELLEWLRPLILHAAEQLFGQLQQELALSAPQALRYIDHSLPSLCLQFHRMTLRTLVLALQIKRLQQSLPGVTSAERYQAFLQQLKTPEQALSLLGEYPVLARQLLDRARQWQATHSEFYRRFCRDQQRLAHAFFQHNILGDITSIDTGSGDRHCDGRSVFIVHFDSGHKLVYKPKPLSVDIAFQQILVKLNRWGVKPALKTTHIVDCGEYGWCEFIAAKNCTKQDEVERFYERQGIYLALLYLLEATDFHYENIIAQGEHPFLIDIETLLQAHVFDNTAVGPGSRVNSATILRSGMLPNLHVTYRDQPLVDLSGLGNSHGRPTKAAELRDQNLDTLHLHPTDSTMPAGHNQPVLNQQVCYAHNYATQVLAGFARCYRLLCVHQDELAHDQGPLAALKQHRIRYIIRGTDTYTRLIHAAFHPDYCRDGLMRDRLFDKLWLDYAYYPAVRPLINAEHEALSRSDVPLFTTRTDSTSLWDDQGREYPNFFAQSGFAQVQQRVSQLSASDLVKQYRLVHDCLCGLSAHPPGHSASSPDPRHATQNQQAAYQATPSNAIDAAHRLGQQIRQHVVHHNGWVGWLQPSLQGDSGWNMLPCNTSLYDGLAGIAVALAALHQQSQRQGYHTLAVQTWNSCRKRIIDNPRALECVGAFAGWGGIFYTASVLMRLGFSAPGEKELALWCRRLRRDLPKDRLFDWIGGASGAIMGLLRCYEQMQDPELLALAVECGDYLEKHQQNIQGHAAWPCDAAEGEALTGLAHGAAGISHSLWYLAHHSGEKRFSDLARSAMAFENLHFSSQYNNWRDRRKSELSEDEQYVVAWCHGATGIGLSRLSLYHQAQLGRLQLPADIVQQCAHDALAATQATFDSSFGYNQCLCHGDIGNLALLETASRQLASDQQTQLAQQQINTLRSTLLHRVQYKQVRPGINNHALVFGLMNGTAGMAYQLLQLHQPQQLPAILSLD